MWCSVHAVEVDMSVDKPFESRFSDLDDPATVSLTDTICAGVSTDISFDKFEV